MDGTKPAYNLFWHIYRSDIPEVWKSHLIICPNLSLPTVISWTPGTHSNYNSPEVNFDCQVSVNGNSQKAEDGALSQDQDKTRQEETPIEVQTYPETDGYGEGDGEATHQNIGHSQRHQKVVGGVLQSGVNRNRPAHQYVARNWEKCDDDFNHDVEVIHLSGVLKERNLGAVHRENGAPSPGGREGTFFCHPGIFHKWELSWQPSAGKAASSYMNAASSRSPHREVDKKRRRGTWSSNGSVLLAVCRSVQQQQKVIEHRCTGFVAVLTSTASHLGDIQPASADAKRSHGWIQTGRQAGQTAGWNVRKRGDIDFWESHAPITPTNARKHIRAIKDPVVRGGTPVRCA